MPQPVLLRDLLPSALRVLSSPARPVPERAADLAPLPRRDAPTLSHLLIRLDEAARGAASAQL